MMKIMMVLVVVATDDADIVVNDVDNESCFWCAFVVIVDNGDDDDANYADSVDFCCYCW